MSHFLFVLPEHPSIMDSPAPELQVSSATDATGDEEEKTMSEHGPPRAQPAQCGEESSFSGKHHTEYPLIFLPPSGEGPFQPMGPYSRLLRGIDGMGPPLQPGNPPTSTRSDLEECDDDESGQKVPAVTSSISSVGMYAKWKSYGQQKVLERRAKRRALIEDIKNKPDRERTEEERELLHSYQYHWQKQNDRSRVIKCILAKPEKERMTIESSSLESALYKKQPENEGDRTHCQRIKQQKIEGLAPQNPSDAVYEAIQGRAKEPMEQKDYNVEDSGKNVSADTNRASRARDQEHGALLTSPIIMSHLKFVLPGHPSIMGAPPPELQVYNPMDAIYKEEKTITEPEPPRAQPAQCGEESPFNGQHMEYPPVFLAPLGKGPFQPMGPYSRLLRGIGGMGPPLQPGNPPPPSARSAEQEFLDRRVRKNESARIRHAKLRAHVLIIKNKPDSERTIEERELLESYQYRQQRSSDQERQRVIERKIEIERILGKPEKRRTTTERAFLESACKQIENKSIRAAKLRARIIIIENKPDNERTVEERELLDSYQYRRQRKNDRERERYIERKTEIERIVAKPEKKRTIIESAFLASALYKKQRVNERGRTHWQHIKQQKIEGLAAQNLSGAAYEAFQGSVKEPTELKDLARIEVIENKLESERTEEERELLDPCQCHQQKKNDQYQERRIEKKAEIESIVLIQDGNEGSHYAS